MKKAIITIIAAFTLCCAMTITCFAAGNTYNYNGFEYALPDDMTYPYYMMLEMTEGNYQLYASTSKVYEKGGAMKYVEDGNVKIFVIGADGNWNVQQENKEVKKDGYWVTMSSQYHWASYDIEDRDTSEVYAKGDSSFFSLAERVLKVAGMTLEMEAVPQMGGTMRILVACGVGLMALLVVLKLFGKRSLLFLNR